MRHKGVIHVDKRLYDQVFNTLCNHSLNVLSMLQVVEFLTNPDETVRHYEREHVRNNLKKNLCPLMVWYQLIHIMCVCLSVCVCLYMSVYVLRVCLSVCLYMHVMSLLNMGTLGITGIIQF